MGLQELSEKEFKKLKNSEYDLEKDNDAEKEMLLEAYRNIIDILKEYIDIKEEYYNIISLWIIGTYFHDKFPSYPFLFFNAQKGSGKSRTINLITFLSKDGSMMNSMTEAVLFRTNGTLAIDEFEGIGRKGNENLRELLNSAYKKGVTIKRMKKSGDDQVVEEFEVYRPIILANIWGMESVLGDRCITLILEKSSKKVVTNLIEIFQQDEKVVTTKQLLEKCSLCRCSFSAETYKSWNFFIKNNYTNYTHNTNNINDTNYILPFLAFKSIKSMELNGRELELSFPLCLISSEISEDVLKETTLTLKAIFSEKRAEELVEDRDVSLIDFVSQEPLDTTFQTINKITENFKNFISSNEEWINSKWMGRALKRLNLYKEKRRSGRGVEVILNIPKAQNKIKMFK